MPWQKSPSDHLLTAPGDGGPTYSLYSSAVGPSGGGPGGTNKAMMSLLNPAESGKVLKVRRFSVQAESSSGTNVLVLYELRRISAHSSGTAVTPKKHDLSDADSVAEAKKEPTVTEISAPTVMPFIMQANTAQAPGAHFVDLVADGLKPIVLRPGQGLVMHHVTSNGGTFHTGLVYTEEPE